jgi:hypothetical protein
MECKIDHTLDGAIPKALCCMCTPRQTASQIIKASSLSATMKRLDTNPEPVLAGVTGAAIVHYDRKVKRQLKAEVKAWRERVEAMERRYKPADPALMKARETLRKAETDLYMVL